MTKLFNLKDWVLLSAGVANDVLGEFKSVGGVVPALFEHRYGYFPPHFKTGSFNSSVSRLVKSGDIKKTFNAKGRANIELTVRGKLFLKKKFSLYTKNSLDETFMVVIFDVPEKKRTARNTLRVKLKELGFGKLQESVWISPYHFESDLKDFLTEMGYLDYIFVMRSTRILGKDLKENVKSIWNLSEIDARYSQIIDECQKVINTLEKQDLFNMVQRVWNSYFKALSIDPFLPKELLPSDWHRDLAKTAIERISKYIDKKLTTVKK